MYFKSGLNEEIMPKNKNKNHELMTGSLKVKPKKRPGLVKQLSQPFFSSKKKNKNDFPEPVVLISTRSKDDMVLLNGYDDMFMPDGNRNSENIFMSPDTDDYNIEFERCPLKIKLPPRDQSSSSDSGYTSPPCSNEVCSPNSSTPPAKGILKKLRPMSPIGRCDSPSPGILSSEENNLSQLELSPNNRPMSPVERAMSPLGMEFESALDILDDVIEQETSDSDKKYVKKSVSFGELPEVKNYISDSSDNDICDGIKPFKKSVSTGNIDVIHMTENLAETHRPVKKSVSFDDVSPVRSEDSVKKSVSFDDIVTTEMDSSLSESDSDGCTCDQVCNFEVEVKVVDIQPQGHEVQSPQGQSEGQGETCKELDKFSILVSKILMVLRNI